MAWSTKGAIIGDLHGLQVNRHYPHHSPFICSFWEQDLSILQDFLRIYGFEGEAPEEGEGFTRNRESSYRRIAFVCSEKVPELDHEMCNGRNGSGKVPDTSCGPLGVVGRVWFIHVHSVDQSVHDPYTAHTLDGVVMALHWALGPIQLDPVQFNWTGAADRV